MTQGLPCKWIMVAETSLCGARWQRLAIRDDDRGAFAEVHLSLLARTALHPAERQWQGRP
jgi:hypothetical protein